MYVRQRHVAISQQENGHQRIKGCVLRTSEIPQNSRAISTSSARENNVQKRGACGGMTSACVLNIERGRQQPHVILSKSNRQGAGKLLFSAVRARFEARLDSQRAATYTAAGAANMLRWQKVSTQQTGTATDAHQAHIILCPKKRDLSNAAIGTKMLVNLYAYVLKTSREVDTV